MPLVQAEQHSLEVGFLQYDPEPPSACNCKGIPTRLLILLEAVGIQQHQPMLDLPTPRMSSRAAPGRFDNICRVTTIPRFHVEMKVKPLFVTAAPEELDKRPVALSFDPDKDDSPARYPRSATHGVLTDSRETAQHTRSVLRIEARIPAKPPDILGTVYAGCACGILLDDEDLFLFELVEETDVM